MTGDGGGTWTPHRLPEPADVPAAIGGSLQPVGRPGGPVVLLLRLVGGVYAYDSSHGWSRAHRLPMTPTRNGFHPLAFGTDGHVCAASGRDLWVAERLGGAWEHRPVPLHADEAIADVALVDTGVLWLTTTRYPAPGTPPSGRLYCTDSDGAVWTPVPVESQERTGHA